MSSINDTRTISSDTLEHYGIKGMRWGVRRTPEQLGHAVSHGRDAIAGFLSKKKKNIAKSVKQHDSEKLKKQQNAIKKVEAKNAQMAKQIELKQQMAAAKQRSRELKKMRHAPSSIEEVQKKEKRAQRRAQIRQKIREKMAQRKAEKREAKRLDKLARQQAIRQAGSQLLTNTLVNVGNSAIKTAATSITNDDSYSESVRNFAEYMGGVKKQNDNSLDLLKTKSFNEMSDAELRSISDRFKTQVSIDSILKKERQEYQSSQNGYHSSTTSLAKR